MLVRFLYAAAALLAAGGAAVLTWATAYRPTSTDTNQYGFLYRRSRSAMSEIRSTACLFSSADCFGPRFRACSDFLVMLCERNHLAASSRWARRNCCSSSEYGEAFRSYAQRVPRFLPSLRPRFEDGGQSPRWRQALWDQAFQWGFVATLLAFAFTLSDPIGYAFGGATIAFLVLQRLSQFLWIRLRRA